MDEVRLNTEAARELARALDDHSVALTRQAEANDRNTAKLQEMLEALDRMSPGYAAGYGPEYEAQEKRREFSVIDGEAQRQTRISGLAEWVEGVGFVQHPPRYEPFPAPHCRDDLESFGDYDGDAS